jgi:hypothetical protein
MSYPEHINTLFADGNDGESGTAFQFPAPPETLTPASTSFASEAG